MSLRLSNPEKLNVVKESQKDKLLDKLKKAILDEMKARHILVNIQQWLQ